MRPHIICPQRHRANTQRRMTWRVTELYGAQRRRRRRRMIVLWGYERVPDWKFRTQKYADTAVPRHFSVLYT